VTMAAPTRSRFAASLSLDPVPAHAVGEAAGDLLEAFGGDEPDLLVCVVSPHLAGALDDIARALTDILDPGVVLGMAAAAVIGGSREVDDDAALSLFAACLPDATLTPISLSVERSDAGPTVMGWPELDQGDDQATLVLLADPFSFPAEGFLRALDAGYAGLNVVGGFASGARGPGGNHLLLASDARSGRDVATGAGTPGAGAPMIRSSGAVGLLMEGVEVRTVVSQGCRPIGQPLVVTRATGNRIVELGGRPAMDRLRDCAAEASLDDLDLIRHGLQLGLVVDEHQVDFDRGDFLIRPLVGADPDTGTLVVDGDVSVGRTVQFHVRDATAADDELRDLLTGLDASAALLFTDTGRGIEMFGEPDHDAEVVDRLLGPLPVAGACCAGEFGPVGGSNFVHRFTAGLALFT